MHIDINKVYVSVVIFLFLFGILVGIVSMRSESRYSKGHTDTPTDTVKIEETSKSSPEPTPEVSKEPEYVM